MTHSNISTQPLRLSILFLLLAAAVMGVRSAELTRHDCHADRQAMHDDLARNRAGAVRMLHTAIATAATEYEREHLRIELERVWDLEEEQRALADRVWRDCLAHIRRREGQSR